MADLARVVQSNLGAVPRQCLSHSAQLKAHLSLTALGQSGLAERRKQRKVGIAGGLRLRQVKGVLTEVVDRAQTASQVKLARHPHGVSRRVASHEPPHDVPTDRSRLDQVTHAITLSQLQQHLAQYTAWVQHVFLLMPSSVIFTPG